MSKKPTSDDDFSNTIKLIKEYQETVKKSIGDDFSEGKVRNLMEQAIDPDFTVSFNAKQLLKGMGVNILPVLVKMLGEEERDPVRIVILGTLGALEDKANFVVPLLIKMIEEDDNERIRSISIGVLNNIVKETDYLIPIFLRALKNDVSSDVQRNAEWCLNRRAKESGHENISDLVKTLYSEHSEDYLASAAIEILIAKFVSIGDKHFGDGNVPVEDLIVAGKLFSWAIQLNAGPLNEWIGPRLLFIYDKLGHKK